MERGLYDLTHFAFQQGRIGRLQTISMIPIMAGDSLTLNLSGIIRLSPLRRQLVVDAIADFFIFYMPYRHTFGDDWEDFILQGIDETITFSTVNFGTQSIEYLGTCRLTGVNPLWLTAMYNRVWNRYFRVPTDTTAVLADTFFPTAADTNAERFGQLCARTKCIWTTGIDATVDASDREVPSVSVMDILDLARTQGRYRSEQLRDWFGQRYPDILKSNFGGNAGPDAEERPTLVMRSTNYMSGYDVDGTGDASLGTYSGKSVSMANIGIPRRFFPEHGTLMVMALVRFPTIHQDETHYLIKNPNPTYKQISGDPALWENEPPIEHEVQDFFTNNTSSQSLGTMPYGQWYRYHPNIVHDGFREVTGFSFLNNPPTSKDEARYVQNLDYSSTFQTEQLGHWQLQARLDVMAHRSIPGPLVSVFAGSNAK